jgi:hypothetical protein
MVNAEERSLMVQPRASKKPADNIEVEPGAEKRLANILKKALNTPPARSQAKGPANPSRKK